MRKIKFIVIHCTAGSAQQRTSDIWAYWKSKLWSKPGYHKLVSADGTYETLADDETITNGVHGFNAVSIHICYKGGLDGKDTRTEAQKETIGNLIQMYMKKYPQAMVLGHRDLSPDLNGDGKISPNEYVKLCPCFSVRTEYAKILKIAA